MRVIFRTNGENKFPGFVASIICFDPDRRDMVGCTRPEGMNTEESTQMRRRKREESTQMRRGKRELENFVSVLELFYGMQ